METCYKAFRAEILKSIPLRSNRFGMEPELTAKVAKRGLAVYEVPISYHGRRYSEGKKIGWKDGFSALYTILKYWLIDDCYDEEQVREMQLLQTMENSRNFVRLFVKKAVPFFGTKIIEFDSGIGNLSKYLPQRERLTLSDAQERNLKILRNSYDGNAVVDVQRFDLANGSDGAATLPADYDTAILTRRLAEMGEDVAALRKAGSVLEQGGRLVLMVPAGPSLSGPHDKETGLLRRYTKKRLRIRLEEAGFTVETSQYVNVLGVLLLRWAKLRQKKELGRVGLKIFDTLLPLATFFERWLPYSGADLFVVAVKK